MCNYFVSGALAILLITSPALLISQSVFSTTGYHISIFDQKLGGAEFDVDYHYQSINLDYSRTKSLLNRSFFSINWEIIPHMGYTSIKNPGSLIFNVHGIEVGALLGVSFELSLFQNFWRIYVGGTIGPQFISNTPKRQKSGFILSDNAFVGNRFRIHPNRFIDIRLGVRHQSNANLGQPNGGINSMMLGFGLLFSS